MVYKAEWLSLVYGLFCLGGRFLYSVYVAQDKILCFFEQDYVGKKMAMSLTTAQRLSCWQRSISHLYICYYKLLLIPNSHNFLAFLTPLLLNCAVQSRLYCHYKPFVLPLQAFCSPTTKHLQCRYKAVVARLQVACSVSPCQKAHRKGVSFVWPKLVYVCVIYSKRQPIDYLQISPDFSFAQSFASPR